MVLVSCLSTVTTTIRISSAYSTTLQQHQSSLVDHSFLLSAAATVLHSSFLVVPSEVFLSSLCPLYCRHPLVT